LDRSRGGQHLDEAGSVRSGDLNLPFNRHVTQDGVVDQVPEVLFRVTEVTRNVHVVVDRETLRTPAHGGVEIGGFADLGAEAEIFCLCHVECPCMNDPFQDRAAVVEAASV
jgi:hypothetical protein